MTVCFLMWIFNYLKWEVHIVCNISEWKLSTLSKERKLSFFYHENEIENHTSEFSMSGTYENDSTHTFFKNSEILIITKSINLRPLSVLPDGF